MNIFKNIFHGLKFFAKKISCFLSSPFGTEKLCFSDTKDRETGQDEAAEPTEERPQLAARGPAEKHGIPFNRVTCASASAQASRILEITLGRKKQILKSVYKAQMLLSMTIVSCSKGQKSPEMEARRHLGYDRTDSCWEPA